MSTKKLKSKLLPCAHCGRKPKIYVLKDFLYERNGNAYDGYEIDCKCGVYVQVGELTKVVKIWNTRVAVSK